MTRRPRLFGIDRTRSGLERAVDDELRFHFDMTVRELMAGGMNPTTRGVRQSAGSAT